MKWMRQNRAFAHFAAHCNPLSSGNLPQYDAFALHALFIHPFSSIIRLMAQRKPFPYRLERRPPFSHSKLHNTCKRTLGIALATPCFAPRPFSLSPFSHRTPIAAWPAILMRSFSGGRAKALAFFCAACLSLALMPALPLFRSFCHRMPKIPYGIRSPRKKARPSPSLVFRRLPFLFCAGTRKM